MTAAISGPVAFADVSEMAVRDSNRHWSEVHRALSWHHVDAEATEYLAACGLEFKSPERRPVPLSSGWVTGPLCNRCFGHLPTVRVAS